IPLRFRGYDPPHEAIEEAKPLNGKSVRPLVRAAAVFAFLVAGLAMVDACGTDTTAEKDNGPEKPSSTASPTAAGEGGSRRIPQPVVPGDIPVAPESERVDLSLPTFSHPTNVTNPLFPVSKQGSVLFVGHVDGKPFRTEVTLLPETRIIEWQGQQIETLVSQYVAYLDGRIEEVAYDLYAQADDGSVWYFGEDVADFEDGAIVTKEGTWIVGKDGPAAMIMPADPKVGDVYRTENIPGIAFEEVTVKSSTGRSRARWVPSREDSSPRSSIWMGRQRTRPSLPATASSSRPAEVMSRPSPSRYHRRALRARTGRARDPVERRARRLRRGPVQGLERGFGHGREDGRCLGDL